MFTRFLFVVFLSIGLLSCSSESQTAVVENVEPSKDLNDSLAIDFGQIITGVWVLSDYISDIKKTKSPLKSSALLEGVCTMIIDGINFQDSTSVGVSWNNHEGMSFMLYNQQGQTKTQLKTNLFDYDNEENYFELGYKVNEGDTSLVINHYDTANQLIAVKSYSKVLQSQDNNSCDWGISYIVNQEILSGNYAVIDSNAVVTNITCSNDGLIEGHPDFDSFYIYTDFNGGPIANYDGINLTKGEEISSHFFKCQKDTLYMYSMKVGTNSLGPQELDKLVYRFVSNNKNGFEINNCEFSTPDTSVSGIKFYDRQSITKVLGKQTELVGDSTNKFYSASGNQYVNLLVWPGGSKNKVDYIEVGYEESSPVTQNKTNISEFMSEKGIKLGLTHNEVVNILGECYTTVTDSNDVKVIEYKLEPPKDTKSRLMYRVNMPVYVAKYCFSKEKLLLFEFGFEYP